MKTKQTLAALCFWRLCMYSVIVSVAAGSLTHADVRTAVKQALPATVAVEWRSGDGKSPKTTAAPAPGAESKRNTTGLSARFPNLSDLSPAEQRAVRRVLGIEYEPDLDEVL